MLRAPHGADDICDTLLPPALIRDGPGLLVSTVIEGRLVTLQSVERALAAEIAASAKLTPRGFPVEVSGSADGTSDTRSVIAHLRPRGSIAVQSAFIRREALMEYYALANENPETWAELEALIDGYITGEDPGEFGPIREAILSLWERLARPEALSDYRRRLFAAVAAELVQSFDSLDLPPDAWATIETVAAAEALVSAPEAQ